MTDYSFSPDDDRIVSHDASRLGLYYHYVRDVIIYFTLSGWNHGVLSRLSEWITVWIWLRGFAFKGTDLIYIHCVSNENFAVTVKGYMENIYMQTKKISHRCSCCQFACGRIIRWGKKPWADTDIKVLLVISRYKASQDSAIVSGLLTEKKLSPELLLCFNYAASQRSVWGLLWNSELILNQLEEPVEDILLVLFTVSRPKWSYRRWTDQIIARSFELRTFAPKISHV